MIRFVPLVQLHVPGSIHTSGKRDVANEAPDSSDRGWFVAHAARHALGVFRGELLNVFVLDLA